MHLLIEARKLRFKLFRYIAVKQFTSVVIFFILLALPVTVLLSQQEQSIRSKAAGEVVQAIETETSVLSGAVKVGLDANASGGQYIQFGVSSGVPTSTPSSAPPAGASFQPTAPYYATFYYMWYKNQPVDGAWSYWSDQGSPPNTWFSHYLPDPNPSVFDPLHELYSVNDYNNFKWQVSKMAEAKQEVAIASWWGIGRKEDAGFNNIINSFMGRPDNPYPNLRWAVYYEKEGFGNPPVTELVNDLNYIKSNYVNNPWYLKINGKPVVFVYNAAHSGSDPLEDLSRWQQARSQTGFYVVMKRDPLSSGVSASSMDSWHEYAPASRTTSSSPYWFAVSPGFWLDGQAERLPRDLTAFENGAKAMVASSVTWKLTETWNEWGEGSSVEPGELVRFNATTGRDEPDASASVYYNFRNSLITILANNLPRLEQGTGVGITYNPTPISTPTGVVSGDPIIATAGDIACGTGSTGAACKQMETSNLLSSINPDAVLTLGDTQYESGALSDFNNFYDPSWGRFKAITHPAVGNHEYLTSGAAGYFDYFNGVGNQNGLAGDRSKGYYAYDLGTWRLYALNSQCSSAGGCNVGSPQETWLRQDLAANPRTCVLAYYHHPHFTSGSRGGESKIQDLFTTLYNAGAEIVLAGHEHNYERFAPQTVSGIADPNRGIREFVVGTGGRNFTTFTHLQANSESRNNNTFGVLKLILRPTSYNWQFIPIAGSTFTDSGSYACH